jgi:glucosamine-6-phosphate deaminase
MGAELVYQAGTVVLLANGDRKVNPVAESLLEAVTPDVPISYGQVYAKRGGNLVYVIDKVAASELLTHQYLLKEKNIEIKVVST